jgi:hypothetical protein
MRLLLKCPTRSRPQRIASTLATYIRLAARPDLLGVAVSCDVDDDSMTRTSVQDELHRILAPTAWHQLFYSPNQTKIEACNANMDEIQWEWDIVVLVSDDMVAQVKGWDDTIRHHMTPDTDRILWFNDGGQGANLNTLSVYGRAMYTRLGSMYCPEYKSLFCDTELTDRCRGELSAKTTYIPHCIIRHEHPGLGYSQNMDSLYARNQRYWSQDLRTYIRRKSYATDVSFLIPTIRGREASFQRLVASIHEKMARVAPDLRYTITPALDNRETSIGLKRDRLLQGATGKYVAFIDDDDEITDAYVEDLRETFRGGFEVMRLRGQIAQYTFTHSVENKLTGTMARGDVFLRPPNHLNPMLADIAKLIRFKDATRGEDLEWTIQLARNGYLRSEYQSDVSRIHYNYMMNGRVVDPSLLQRQAGMSYEEMFNAVYTPATQPAAGGQRIGTLRLTSRGFVSK